ncbi:MAG: bifunctional nuclease family protein [Candidatus Azobacteroides sp.]|nr:bifunctional nuclease family protein [Candidatus Azobacteroides sp.]
MKDKIRLRILGITFSQVQTGAYALILAEEEGNRRIPIIIGTPEAQSIAIFLEGLTPPRPLTHDLFVSFAKSLSVELQYVNIYKYEEGIFFSELVFKKGRKILRIDARTSDAIALAIRVNAPIFMNETIIDDVSFLMAADDGGEEEMEPFENQQNSFESMSSEELQNLLEEAVLNEDYEKASHLRDLIKKKAN